MEGMLEKLLDYLEKYKAKNLAFFDVRNAKCEQDYIVLADFATTIENKLFADEVIKKRSLTDYPEGYNRGEWIIFDLDRILLHTFIPAKREKYNLDKLYQNQKVQIAKPKKSKK